jgi:plastocyanin
LQNKNNNNAIYSNRRLHVSLSKALFYRKFNLYAYILILVTICSVFMKVSSTLFLPVMIIAIIMISTIASIVLFGNSLIANAQSSQLDTSQPGTPQSGEKTFQSISDSFSVLVPEGWAIHDLNNTGFRLLAEVLQGYGVLAQLCPEEQQQQQTISNVSGSSTDNDSRCQASQEDIIHIIRYPNLGARVGFASEDSSTAGNMTADDILAYQIERLKEVGYRDIQIVNSTDTTINIGSSTVDTNDLGNTLPQATAPAKLVEMTYTTNLAPNETRTGYFISTATDATPRNLGMITGYSIFYEGGNSTASGVETTTSAGNLAPPSLPAAVRQVFDLFELIAAAQAAQQVEPQEQPASSLTLDLVSNDTTGVAPATFEFEANIEGGTEPYTINWDFDDGSEESDEETVVHTFDDAGTYDVNLTTTDALNQTASDSLEITVEEPSPAVEEDTSATTTDTTTTDTDEEPSTDATDTTNADENNNEEVIVRIPEGASELTDDAYSPNPVEVTVGDTVTWINDDSTTHTATSGSPDSGSTGMFGGTDESPEIIDADGGTQSFTFDEAGEFPYYCTLHPSMVGTVIVTEG